MPMGRVPIETYTATSVDDARIYGLIDKQIEQGRQVYVVCPMIESTEAADLGSVKELYAQMKTDIFPHRKIGLMYGSLPAKEKEAVMDAFMSKEVQVLVSTTVIEVGVDNPNASIMLILNAERFGLAQLHQLRGRIGRGGYRSICILKSDSDQDIAKERLRTVCKNSDGFKIAEQDLKLRGIGDFFGTRQHGLPEMKIANLYRDAAILKDAQGEIELLFEKDPFLELPGNEMILPMIKRQFGQLYEHIGL
jgi:ATP-dependent DNA helicase RecG